MNWYAIHTKPRQEETARASLEREGIETFFPKLRRKKVVRRKYQWVTGALFPGYLFARFDLEDSRRLVKYANGVADIVSFGGKPVAVDEAIIAAIAQRCQQGVVTIQPPELKPGDAVKIQEGPLYGLEGIFERELSGSQRVLLLLECISKAAHVEVSRAVIEKV